MFFLILHKKDKTLEKLSETHHMRYFFKPEILEFLYGAGFELMDCLDEKTMAQPDFNSWTAYFIARAV